jgi:hypothetical protein
MLFKIAVAGFIVFRAIVLCNAMLLFIPTEKISLLGWRAYAVMIALSAGLEMIHSFVGSYKDIVTHVVVLSLLWFIAVFIAFWQS